MIVETVQKGKLSYRETERQFGLPNRRATAWRHGNVSYLEEGSQGPYIERCRRARVAEGQTI